MRIMQESAGCDTIMLAVELVVAKAGVLPVMAATTACAAMITPGDGKQLADEVELDRGAGVAGLALQR